MGKKIFIVSASARKEGNSDTLCGHFIKGAAEAGHHIEKIRLHEMKIKPCLGCGTCRDSGKCVHDDDMAENLDKMVQADVIVLATPVYFYSMNGNLKQFIDRTYSRFRQMSGKDFYFILTMGAPDKEYAKIALEGLGGYIKCVPNSKEKGIIFGFNDTVNVSAAQEAYALGKQI
jgi:multimeric flavodoxin WrbA